MTIIGEKINSSVPPTREAFAAKDTQAVCATALRQIECGAQYLDVNAAMLPDEPGTLLWAVETILSACGDTGLVIDSADPRAMAHALSHGVPKKLILNSVTLEKHRLEGVLPLAVQYGAGVVALPIDQSGMPKSAEKRIENAERLLERLEGAGIPQEKIYIDIVVEAVSANWEAPRQALCAAAALRAKYPALHLLAGVSNISFGLPKRAQLNRAFVCSAVATGVDTLILDNTNAAMRMCLRSALLINGQDEFCEEYIDTYRKVFNANFN
ncbi:MAG: dihydropteroate synthase [Clostridia bacterium]|nr:dihydropteroate synthase [Clostridia bacterium]